MQQHHYSAADMTGDETFPTHLTRRQATQLIKHHGHMAVSSADGTLVAGSYATDRDGNRFTDIERFRANELGMFRASAILLWLGY